MCYKYSIGGIDAAQKYAGVIQNANGPAKPKPTPAPTSGATVPTPGTAAAPTGAGAELIGVELGESDGDTANKLKKKTASYSGL